MLVTKSIGQTGRVAQRRPASVKDRDWFYGYTNRGFLNKLVTATTIDPLSLILKTKLCAIKVAYEAVAD
jgi:hypothetical protein